MASKLHLELALTPDGWRRDVVVRIDHGVILGLEEPGRSEAQRVSGVVLPGLPNLHSHAFQRAMAGLTERDRKSTRLNSSHTVTSYAVFCLKKKRYRAARALRPIARNGRRALESFNPSALSPNLARLPFFFNDTATTEIYTLSLHDALPI